MYCLNIEEIYTFTRTTSNQSFKINHKLNRDGNCLIYILTCKSVVNNMQRKPLMNAVLDGTITKPMIGKMYIIKHVRKVVCLSILKVKVVVVFLEKFS